MYNRLTYTIAALVAIIAAVAFYLSYDALRSVAAENGYTGLRAFLWPILIDAPLVVFTLALLAAQLYRRSIRLWAGLVILYTLATVAFNLAHGVQTPLGWAVAVAAPLGLLLATEALRTLARDHITRADTVATLGELTQQAEQMTKRRDRLQADIARLTDQKQGANRANVQEMNAARDQKITARRDRVLEMTQTGMTQTNIASELNVSAATVKRDLAALNGRVKS